MELRILKEEKNKLLLETPTEGYTLLNPVVEALWAEKDVEEAAIIKEHPFLSSTKLWVVAPSPKTKIKKAIKNILSEIEKLKAAIKNL